MGQPRRSVGIVILSAMLISVLWLPRARNAEAAQDATPPVIITSAKLTATGVPPPPTPEVTPFSPVSLTTAALQVTGVPPPSAPEATPFAPVTITTATLTATGKGDGK